MVNDGSMMLISWSAVAHSDFSNRMGPGPAVAQEVSYEAIWIRQLPDSKSEKLTKRCSAESDLLWSLIMFLVSLL